jgi:TolB-like protein/DNA-binding winged helix-turn-helix (wHTH) protein/tetratricopeptide (TPR) repeat protein
MDSRQTHLIYEFGEFQLDALRRVLSSRSDGNTLQVTARVFDTLLYFVEHAGQLLEKRTLLDALWPNAAVEEGSLTHTVHALRRVLGEHPDDHRFIVTVPGRGYRFVGDVRTRAVEAPVPAVPTAQARRTRLHDGRLLALMLLALAVGAGASLFPRSADDVRRTTGDPRTPSIAVLPFVDMSAEGNQAYFADGLSEEILNFLAQSAQLRVIARTSSFSFKDRNVDIATIASELDVTHVLEGSVRRSGERIRITAQLVDAGSSAHVWSETYDRDVEDIFAVQRDIAAAVAESLNITLTGKDLAASVQANSPRAFERYLQGRYFFHRRGGAEDLARARSYFEQALTIDPTYARAWVGLAGTYWVESEEPMSEETLLKWRDAIERGLRFAPNLPEAHVRAAQYHWKNGDLYRGNEHFARARALDSSDQLVLAVSAGYAMVEGRLDEAIAFQRHAVAVDPLAASYRGNLGTFLMADGEWEEAKVEFEKALALSPLSLDYYAQIAQILIVQQRFAEALSAIAKVPEGRARLQCLALVHHAMGNVPAGDAALASLITLAETSDSDLLLKLAIADVYAFRGDSDAAFKWLASATQQAQDDRDVAVRWRLKEGLQLSPFLRSLSADPRWQPVHASAMGR